MKAVERKLEVMLPIFWSQFVKVEYIGVELVNKSTERQAVGKTAAEISYPYTLQKKTGDITG